MNGIQGRNVLEEVLWVWGTSEGDGMNRTWTKTKKEFSFS